MRYSKRVQSIDDLSERLDVFIDEGEQWSRRRRENGKISFSHSRRQKTHVVDAINDFSLDDNSHEIPFGNNFLQWRRNNPD